MTLVTVKNIAQKILNTRNTIKTITDKVKKQIIQIK